MKTLIILSALLFITACTKSEDTKQITLSSAPETTNVSSVPISITEKTVAYSTTK